MNWDLSFEGERMYIRGWGAHLEGLIRNGYVNMGYEYHGGVYLGLVCMYHMASRVSVGAGWDTLKPF